MTSYFLHLLARRGVAFGRQEHSNTVRRNNSAVALVDLGNMPQADKVVCPMREITPASNPSIRPQMYIPFSVHGDAEATIARPVDSVGRPYGQ